MKVTKLLIVLCFFCCILIACERPRVYTREDFIDRTLELATFLTDNYTERKSSNIAGDTVVFKMDSGDLTTFLVEINYIQELVYDGYAWNEGDPVNTIHDGFDLMTRLVSTDPELFFYIKLHYGPPIRWSNDNWTDTYATLLSTYGKLLYDPEKDTSGPYEWKETEDTISIVYANMTCTLKKNVGIVKITCDEHSWELVQ